MKGDVHIISLVVFSSSRKNEDGGERTLMMIMLEHRQSKLHQSLSPPSSFIYIKPACFHSVSASATSSLSSSPPPILSNCHLNHREISVFFLPKRRLHILFSLNSQMQFPVNMQTLFAANTYFALFQKFCDHRGEGGR